MNHKDDQDPLEESHTNDDEGPMAWECRVFAVALVWSCLGTLFGGMVGGLLGAIAAVPSIGVSGLVLGGLFGAVFGGLLEAEHWSP
jgi:hypothetical protein